jgi:multiple sugar transport system substrate-binding protein
MKRREFFIALALILITVSMVFAGGGRQQGGASLAAQSNEITIWGWDRSDRRQEMHDLFTKDTGLNVNISIVESRDMTQKLQTTMAAGGEMPDVAWCEATYRGKLLSLDIWEDTTVAPYNFDKTQVLDYLIPLETSEAGRWVGPECPSVAGMAYKRDLAKEYFGTDDPEELEKLFSDWPAFIRAGQEVQRKSGGKVFMMASLGSAANIMRGQSTEPFITGDKLTLENSMQPILERLIEFKRYGICDVIDAGTPEEGASYATNEHIFYPCANWSLVFTIRANDRNGAGRWGFMLPPGGPFPWGGTVMAVPRNGKNKLGGVTYIKYFFGSEVGARHQRDYMGNFSPFKPLYQQADFYSAKDEFFAGQDVQQAIAQRVLPNIKGVRPPSKYDQDLADVLNLAITSINASTGTSVTAANLIAQMKDELINKQPTITR